MTDLDDPTALRANDPEGMLGGVESTPALWRDAFESANASGLGRSTARTVAVCGMGGSGISGDVLAATAATRTDVPVGVVKGFDLPRWVDKDSLVVCVSYSGNTTEAVMCFDEARIRGCEIVAVAGGGALAMRANEAGVPCLEPRPAALTPRAAFASLAANVLVVGERAGLVPDLDVESAALIAACKEGVERWGPKTKGSDAKNLAKSIAGSHPQIWGQEGMLAVAAQRWKTQLNENAKVNASWAVLPESLHNEIVPLEDAGSLVILRAEVERERISASIDVLDEYEPLLAWAIGTSDLAVLASAVLLGDFVSVYLAALRGVNPTAMEPITRFKKLLG